MSEVPKTGSSRRPAMPWKWVMAAAVVLLVALAVTLFGGGSDRVSKPAPPSPAPAPDAPSVRTSSTPVTSPASPWPSARGACNSTVYLPQGKIGPRPDGIDGSLLVGSTGIQKLALATAGQSTVPGVPHRTGLLVTALVRGPDADYVATTSCDASTKARIYRIVGERARLLPVPGDQFLLGGAHHAWAVHYPLPAGSAGGPVQPGPVLTALDGGLTVKLAANKRLFADTKDGLIVVRIDTRSGALSQIELADVTTGKRLRGLGAGIPMGVAGHTLLVESTSCQDSSPPPKDCWLTRVDLSTGRTTNTFLIAAHTHPDYGTAVLSSDQKVAAFKLARDAPDPRFKQSPLASDIAILHLDTSRLDIIPGLELSPAASAGLAFDATGTAVLVTVSLGDRLELLGWKPGMPAPGLIAQVTGAFDNTTPSVLLTRRLSG